MEPTLPAKAYPGKCSSLIPPNATVFKNSEAKTKVLFFKNNPWKTTNKYQKVYRFCVICGDNRFQDEKWMGVLRNMWGAAIVNCENERCFDEVMQLPHFVPRKHLYIITDFDQQRAEKAKSKEQYESIDDVTIQLIDDKVGIENWDIPAEHRSTFDDFEKIPVQYRIGAVQQKYYDYQRKSLDTTVPYLQLLAKYEEKCRVIYRKLEH